MQRKAGENDPAPGTLPSCSQDTDMRPAQDLAAILAEVRISKSILEVLRKVQKPLAIRTANEIDEHFTKVDTRILGLPDRKQACSAKEDSGYLPQTIVSHYLEIMEMMRHYRCRAVHITADDHQAPRKCFITAINM